MIEAEHPGSLTYIPALGRFLRSTQRKLKIAGEVNVLITSDAEMRRLNLQFRGKNKPTDVLSFPASANGKAKLAGDIAISAEIAAANAEALRHPLEVELKILVLHGLLHLAGYDHETDNGEMAKLEQELRAKLKLPTALIERTSSKVSGKGRTLVVPSRRQKLLSSSSPKPEAQGSVEKKSKLLISANATSGAKAQNRIAGPNGAAKAVPLPRASFQPNSGRNHVAQPRPPNSSVPSVSFVFKQTRRWKSRRSAGKTS